jgi:hypothetical protein
MARFLAVLVFVVSALVARAALAKPHEHDEKTHHAVPELSGAGAAAGLILVGGAAAIALGRRRARKS